MLENKTRFKSEFNTFFVGENNAFQSWVSVVLMYTEDGS